MAENPKIKVINLQSDLIKALRLINKFFEKNDLKIKYTLTLDYSLKDSYGIFFPDEKNNITINPAQFQNTEKEDPHAPYFSNDLSIMAVTVHEVCHMLDEKFKITEKYRERFKERFILNENSKKDRYEELVEIFRMYIVHPFMLRMIANSQFDFFKELFESPTAITKRNFLVKYKKWPKEIRELCLKHWKIKVTGDKVEVLK